MSILTEAVVVLTGDASDLDSVLGKAVGKVEATGRRLQELGNELSLKVTLPLLGVGAGATFAAAKFDEAMRQTVALTSLTADQVENLSGSVREMGSEFGQGAIAAADALFFIATPSLTAAENMEVLEESLRGAAVGLGEAKDIALGVVGALNAYSDAGLTAARATEILAAGTKFGRFEAEELVPQLGRLTGFAAALGIEFESLIGTMSVLTLTGTNTAQAATSLQSIMSTLAGTSTEGEKLLAEFGLSLAGLREVAAGPGGIIEVLRQLDEVTGGNIEQFEAIFPNIRAMRGAMIALAQDSSIVDAAMAGVRNSAGLMDEAISAVEGPMHKLRVAFAQLTDAAISVGDTIQPVVIPLATKLADIVSVLARELDRMPSGVKAVVVVFGMMALAVGPVLSAFGQLITLLPGIALAALGFRKLIPVLANVTIEGQTLRVMWMKMRSTQMATAASSALLAARSLTLSKAIPLVTAALRKAFLATLPLLAKGIALVALFAATVQLAVAVADAWNVISFEADQLSDRIKNLINEVPLLTKVMLTLAFPFLGPAFVAAARDIDEVVEAAHRLREVGEGGFEFVGPRMPRDVIEWLGDALEISEDLQNELQAIGDRALLLGDDFDVVGAEIAAYEDAVQGLTDIHADFGFVLQPLGMSLQEIADKLQVLRRQAQQTEILEGFTESLEQLMRMSNLMGSSFDFAGEQLSLYEQIVREAVAANLALNTVIGPQGETLEQMAAMVELLRGNQEVSAGAARNWADAVQRAKDAVDATLTPVQRLGILAEDLQMAFDAGLITWDEWIAALALAGEETRTFSEDATDEVDALTQGFVDLTTRGIDSFIDSVFDAGTSFGEFVQQALIDISKLILKIELLKLISDSSGNFLGIPLFARGGFLPRGQVGIAGEAGPELITAGQSGVTITPLSGAFGPGMAATDDVAPNVTVVNQVSAMDAVGVQRFFEESEDLVAGALMRVMLRSDSLRRRLG